MSIKKLFDSTNSSRNYLSEQNQKEAFEEIESARNLEQVQKKQQHFLPQIDYSEPEKFARFGSAYLYYDAAFTRIVDYYPYDGSDAEINKFYNQCLDIEKYILDTRYPRTNGYVILSSDGWGTRDGSLTSDGYGKPSSGDLEHITFYGGPGLGPTGGESLAAKSPNPYNDKFQNANIYDTDIYQTEGLPSDYGKGTRESNLRANFGDGITVEFWLKTGSLSPATTTRRQVIFDMWNNEASSSVDYGRLTIAITGSDATGSPFLITAQSGAAGTGIISSSIGQNISGSSLSSWHHYAVSFYNSGSNFVTKLYVDGTLNHESASLSLNLGELKSKNTKGQLGALLTAPSGSAVGGVLASAYENAGKLSGSLDEFRYWKATRTGQQIGRDWFTQVRGGANTDISNTTLGVYYKFNEGITGVSATDSVVLDYAGRVCNGTWTGYSSTSRNVGSAILSASAAIKEYKDPVIRDNNPLVTSLKKELLDKGQFHDYNNNASFLSLLPGWILDDEGTLSTSDLRKLTHIVGAYLDKLYLQITELPKLRQIHYPSASYKPFPYAEHLPQSLGLYSPELFIDATVMEKFANRTDVALFENDISETKNLIYANLYNNLTNIFKSKGTEKAIRNVFRCFNIDDRLLRLNINSNNNEFTLKNNLQQQLLYKNCINLNERINRSGVVYQRQNPNNPETLGYISGSEGLGYEDPYGFTVETDVIFPFYMKSNDKFTRDYRTVSVFGMHTVDTGSADSKTGADTTFVTNDLANFQVLAVKDSNSSKNLYFKLTSSNSPHPFPELTSSVFFDVYDNEQWNLSVRLKPDNYPLTKIVSGAAGTSPSYATASAYDLVFHGINTLSTKAQKKFTLTASVSASAARAFLGAAKRLYLGAQRTNLTGTVLSYSDIMLVNTKYWTRYLTDNDILQHALDIENVGISGSNQHISPLATGSSNLDLLNSQTLALNWNFGNVTGSDATGNFYVQDFSSGSGEMRNNFGWLGKITGYQHSGYGNKLPASSTTVVEKRPLNTYRFISPEQVVSSDMVQIFSEEDLLYPNLRREEIVPNYVYTIEKSLYNAISEEMLDFLAGAVDFNDVIGAPVNRYRHRYKALEKLREVFFRRVTRVADVEKYVEYYKWFDDALTSIIGQLVPASAEFVDDVLNVVESHVLERNKYKTPFPTLDYHEVEADNFMHGIMEKLYPWPEGGSSIPASPRPTDRHKVFWQERALRTSSEITSGDSIVDEQRNKLMKVIWSAPRMSASFPTFSTVDGVQYKARQDILRQFAQLYKFDAKRYSIIKGGVNFPVHKNLEYALTALKPAGPVNSDNNVFVPQNVLLALRKDMVETQDIIDIDKPPNAINKEHKVFKVQHGRDWEDGLGYKNVKSTMAFPFNIMSSSVRTGFNKNVVERVTGGIEITNIHNDVYGPDYDKPMQGPFTEYAVGGHQSRHVPLNKSGSGKGTTYKGLDNYLTRPEAWKILLGTCVLSPSGAIGMVGPDYPWPEANELGMRPYPVTGSQNAVYYRDFIAKRPVNIRNILMTTGSTVLGNYTKNYQILNSFGAYANPRNFVENQPTLPDVTFEAPHKFTTQGRTILDIHRTEEGHFQFMPEYSLDYLQNTKPNDTIITTRMTTAPGIETETAGYKDFRSNEFSVYNIINYRNLTVIKPSQGPSGSISEPTGTGTPGIRVSDIHGKDYGLTSLLARHSARFGRDSLFMTGTSAATNGPGASYDQLPSFQKVHRNNLCRIKASYTYDSVVDGNGNVTDVTENITYTTASVYDNFNVQHQIPRSDRQYQWINNSIVSPDDIRYCGYQNTLTRNRMPFYTSSAGLLPYFSFVTESGVRTGFLNSSTAPAGWPVYLTGGVQPTNRLNTLTLDAVTGEINTVGFVSPAPISSYLNTALNPALTASNIQANYLNLLLTRRQATYGWTWLQTRGRNHPILVDEQKSITLSAITGANVLTHFRLPPLSLKGRTSMLNFEAPIVSTFHEGNTNNITLKSTETNEYIYFSDLALNNFVDVNYNLIVTPLDKLIDVTSLGGFKRNWLLYSQNVFPSLRNEFFITKSFDNKYWRNSSTDRRTVGDTFSNSFNIVVSQSCWLLDPPSGFLTRTGPTSINEYNVYALRDSGSAGELQNTYFFYGFGSALTGTSPTPPTQAQRNRKVDNMVPSGLYSRKHMMSAPTSVAGPGIVIPEITSSVVWPWDTGLGQQIEIGAGEAEWEVGSQAGIIVKSGNTLVFEASASLPWFNSYTDFNSDLKRVFKGYQIIPEFRISENMEDYAKYGLLNKGKTDWLEISETHPSINSSTDTFYKDYSNSDFLQGLLKIKSETLMDATQIRLVCSAAIRYNPYKGFYPAQRTLDLVSQFSRSFGSGLLGEFEETMGPGGTAIVDSGGRLRPIMQALTSPGILFNSIKSGMAVDYPIATDPTKIRKEYYGASSSVVSGENPLTDNWALTTANLQTYPVGQFGPEANGYYGNHAFWDKRLPFETIIDPAKYLKGFSFYDMEPHPSASFGPSGLTSSWSGESDSLYSLMARNFFGEVGAFFLEGGNYTRLEGRPVPNTLQFRSGSVYGARIKLRKSNNGARTYNYESSSAGNNTHYGRIGAKGYDVANSTASIGTFPLPQDPFQNPNFRSFSMYSRPSAFGPPCAGRPTGSLTVENINTLVAKSYRADSFEGHNWSFTPPYYDGEAWVDLIFRPTASVTYNLESILEKTEFIYRRADAGYIRSDYLGPLLLTGASDINGAIGAVATIYDGKRINYNAMQISASINLLGVERILTTERDARGQLKSEKNEVAAMQWVLSPKFETPIYDFNGSTRTISNASGTLAIPVYGSASVPRGIWHQFGIIEPDPKKGIFLEIEDIPTDWLKYHYNVRLENSVYNDFNKAKSYDLVRNMKSFTDLMGIERDNRSVRLGQIAEKKTIYEAVVAIPYLLEDVIRRSDLQSCTPQATTRKKFINIPKRRFLTALQEREGTPVPGEAPAESVRTLLDKMNRYILPPQFDFLNNRNINPIVMYIFEFKFQFDRDDLSYIWQNTAPRDYQRFSRQHQAVTHELFDTELLRAKNLLQNQNLRWMVFKIKQRSQTDYYDLVPDQASHASERLAGVQNRKAEYPLRYNWPYDYLSFIELIRMDVDVLFKEKKPKKAPTRKQKQNQRQKRNSKLRR